jgi:hypothetical protein
MALLDILGCAMEELIEPVMASEKTGVAKAAAGGVAGVGDLRPCRARIAAVKE